MPNSKDIYTSTRLFIDETGFTPLVDFDFETNSFTISGRIIPENPIQFFDVLNAWLDEHYINSKLKQVNFNIKLDFFNTSSAKCLVVLINKFISLKEKGSLVNVNWFYAEDDEEIKEAGEDYSFLVKHDFNFVETSS